MSLGRTLKETRIRRGISLSDVSRELLITEEYIEAIEDGINEVLPSETYRRIYTRAYCKFLGVEFREESQPAANIKVVTSTSAKNKKNDDGDPLTELSGAKRVSSEQELEFPFDVSRVTKCIRISGKIIATIIILYLVIKFFVWIFTSIFG